MLQQVGSGGRSSELPPCFHLSHPGGFRNEFPASSLGVRKCFCNATSVGGCSEQTPLPSCTASVQQLHQLLAEKEYSENI